MAKRRRKGGAAKRKKKKKAGSSIPAAEADVGTKDMLARGRVDIFRKDLYRLATTALKTERKQPSWNKKESTMRLKNFATMLRVCD